MDNIINYDINYDQDGTSLNFVKELLNLLKKYDALIVGNEYEEVHIKINYEYANKFNTIIKFDNPKSVEVILKNISL